MSGNPLFSGFPHRYCALLHHLYTISATIAISSLSVSSSTWQYKSIVICSELCPNSFCKVFGRIPFAIQFVAKVCLKQCGVNRSNFSVGFTSLIRSIRYKIAVLILLPMKFKKFLHYQKSYKNYQVMKEYYFIRKKVL